MFSLPFGFRGTWRCECPLRAECVCGERFERRIVFATNALAKWDVGACVNGVKKDFEGRVCGGDGGGGFGGGGFGGGGAVGGGDVCDGVGAGFEVRCVGGQSLCPLRLKRIHSRRS